MKEFVEKFKILMTYAYERKIKGGKSPKTAPTYIAEKH
jgi:hypothetical protein